VVSPDPLARARRVSRKGWPYATALVVVLAVVGSVFRHHLSWGDFPTWIAGITTLLAFLAAAFAWAGRL
jgi:protein-S-isoprenylcysteine O-methyltransferase Ste14